MFRLSEVALATYKTDGIPRLLSLSVEFGYIAAHLLNNDNPLIPAFYHHYARTMMAVWNCSRDLLCLKKAIDYVKH
jgi:hypothetical protein